jgi:hypothetical protein
LYGVAIPQAVIGGEGMSVFIPNRMPPFDSNNYVSAYMEGVKAIMQYLEEPCSEHPFERKDFITGCYRYPEHRKNCSTCWQELKESVK